ncbi:MAG: hypothetical protein U0R44_06650 [Candidatus Micrarchaeia archaeon]
MRQLTAHPASPPSPPFQPKGAFGPPLLDNPHRACIGLKVYPGYEGLDRAQLRKLIEQSFGRKLSSDYFDNPAEKVILAEGAFGAAILKSIAGVPYLDKFVVSPQAQGNGLGRAIWQSIKSYHPTLIWRASPANPCNCWYERNSEGSMETGGWKIYWYGLEPSKAALIAQDVAALPKTIIR